MTAQLNVLLADDDMDDRFFFDKALKSIMPSAHLTTMDNGENLMSFLNEPQGDVPDVLFLDLNMPRKNGSECLSEIKSNARIANIPVIIYSTSMHEDVADLLYEAGAHYYIRKTDLKELKKVLAFICSLINEQKLIRPDRDKFVLSMVNVHSA